MEKLGGLPAEAESASEYRYREPYLDGQTLTGTVYGHEIEILIPSSEHDQVKTLSKGDVLNIDAHFYKLNAYNRKVSFLGTLKSGLQEPHPADIQKEAPAKEPDPIQSAELAEALKGKRIFVLMAGTLEKESTDPGDAKGDEMPETHPENMEIWILPETINYPPNPDLIVFTTGRKRLIHL